MCRAGQPSHSPYLQNVSAEQATVVWNSELSGAVTIEYGLNGAWTHTQAATATTLLPSETKLSNTLYRYSAALPNLQPGQQYNYRVRLDGQEITSGSSLTFGTPRTDGHSFRFLVFGDSGQGCPEQTQLGQLMTNEPADLVIHTGDIAYPLGSYEYYLSRYFDTYRGLMQQKPVFPCPGNHDVYFEGGTAYRAMHSLPSQGVPEEDIGHYYTFEWSNAHFYSLDTNCLDTDNDDVLSDRATRMLAWLEQQLQQARQFWRIVFFHHSPYASGEHAGEKTLSAVRRHFVPVLDRYAVPVVLAGHEHSYQRTYPLRNGQVVPAGTGATYFTSGGGGGSLYPCKPGPLVAFNHVDNHYLTADVQGSKLRVTARVLSGKVVDTFTSAPSPVVRPSGVVDAASFQPQLAAGGQISIFGFHLAETEAVPNQQPSAENLAGTTVTLNGRSLQLLYVSPSQINLKLPNDFTGPATLQINTGNGSTSTAVEIQSLAPALFSDGVRHFDGVPVSDRRPAVPGEELTMLATGLGVTVDGPSTLVKVAVSVKVGALIVPARAAAFSETAGLYRIAFTLPREIIGPQKVRIIADSLASNAIVLPVTRAASTSTAA